MELTVLCENSVAGPFGLIGEHGWAVHLKAGDKNYLFDTGQGLGLIRNSLVLDVDLRDLDGIILSHGHYDHTSGLPAVLELTHEIEVFAHPDCFLSRCWQKDETSRQIGIRYKRDYLESLGARFTSVLAFTEIAPGIHLSGEIPRVSDFEPPDPHMKIQDSEGAWIQDPLLDDLSLVVETNQGLVVVLGCAHAGLINILTQVGKRFPDQYIHTVIGGTHLGFAGQEQFEATVAALHDFGVQRLGAGHCTGLENAARLFHVLGEKYFFSSVGVKFTVSTQA